MVETIIQGVWRNRENRLAEVKEASGFLHPRDAIRRKQLISRLRGIPPRNTLRFTLSYAVALLADYG